MRRRWRARRFEAAVEALAASTVDPRAPDEWDQDQDWVLPHVDDGTPGGTLPASPGGFSSTPPPPPAPDVSTELVRVLEVVTSMCGQVIGFVEADREDRRLMMQAEREERRAMIEALSLLINRLGDQPAIAAPRERVIGGSMPAGPETLIDLRELETAREVCCRFGDQWLDGFEIAEKVEDELGVRYRLRRRIDGAILPELFAPADIRHADAFNPLNTFDALSATAAHGNWSAAITTSTEPGDELDEVAAGSTGRPDHDDVGR